ncbi:hypothetical protein [Nocardioides sp. URHA0032]|nr:hypothetical protein [Nocardioides sp. URHA0032]
MTAHLVTTAHGLILVSVVLAAGLALTVNLIDLDTALKIARGR